MSNTNKRVQSPNSFEVLPGANFLRSAKYTILFLFLSVFLAFFTGTQAQAQAQKTKMYEGVVVEENGQPIVGATVAVAGTNIGTITDVDGKFTIAVPADKEVEISFVGYISQKIEDLGTTQITLKEDLLNLDEVVVVGYSSQKKAHLTGAVVTVQVDDVTDLASGGLATALSGIVNGLSVSGGDGRPGENARLTIRQSSVSSSLSAVSGFVPDSGPLYVIDGFISTESAFNNLDASMVESISVLKDAAAAVYGARSANGVILVTTKRGENGKPRISYSGQFGLTDEVSRAELLDSYNYGKIWNAVRAADPRDTWDPLRDLFQSDELQSMRGLNYDLLDWEWRAALTQRHSVNISGASEGANYYGGLSYYTQDGNMGNIDYERWNYRAGVDLKITDWVKTSLQVSGDYGSDSKAYSKVGGSNSERDYNSLLARPGYIPEYVNGYPVALYGVSNAALNESQHYHYDIIQSMGDRSESMPQNMTINTALEYDFGWSKQLKGLKLRYTYSKSISTSKTNQKATAYDIYSLSQRAGSGEHLYTGSDLNLDESNFQKIIVTNGNALTRSTSRGDRYQMNFVASYNRSFGLHDVSGLFTIEKSESEAEDLQGSVTSPYSFTNGQSNSATGIHTTSFGRSESGNLSYIGRANYAYADKYLFEFLIRSDASTKFAPENYWGTFYSLSGGWVATEESWFKKAVSFVDYFKLRGSFGLTGRDNIKPWFWTPVYNLSKDKGPIFGTGGASTASGPHIGIPDQSPNRDARWDKSYKANAGIDLATLKSRLSANIDAYYEWNRDVFVTRSANVPWTIGTRPSAENYGEIDVWGAELAITWRDKIGKDFKYSIGINTGYTDNKVLKMPWKSLIPIDELHPGERQDVGTWGYNSIGMFRSYQEIEEYFDKYSITNYLGNSKDGVHPGMLIYEDVRGSQNADGSYEGPDGIINTNDWVQLSKRSDNPYGFTMNLKAEYKSVSISAQFNASWGGYTLVPKTARSISNMVSSGSGYQVMEYTNLPSFWADNMFVYEDVVDNAGEVVAAENRDAKYPNLRYGINDANSTFWRVSGTRVTLRNVTMAYSLPRTLVTKLGVESCRFNLTAQNLLSLYNPYPDKFIDPLAGSYGSYPNLRKITLGVNVSF
ncbi:SusC/RagA family TonB-linked outer membrane protein [Mangrovibacterium sp.]|uniref:SusC/RagA family TonB-linked outer membrane protein n=1 Tax=Mangrovibacterium sp. TaxID=1961364 RepID=UPI00356A0806